MITRNELNILQARLDEPRKFIQVLAGPRQVGKTTIIDQLVHLLAVPYTSVSADGILC